MEAALAVALVVLVLVGGALWFLLTSSPSEGELIEQRLNRYAVARPQGAGRQGRSVLRRKQYSRIAWVDAIARRADFVDALARKLQRAGVPMRAGEFLVLQVALGAVASLAVPRVLPLDPGQLAAAGGGAAVGFLTPLVWLRLKTSRRLSQFETELPDSVDLIVGALRAGHGINHGLEMVARELPGPSAEEFGQVLQELSLGADLDTALARLVERVNSQDAMLLATAGSVQRRTGGNLVEVLSQISHVIRERLRLRGEGRVIPPGPRASGYVVALLPLLAMGMMYVTSPYHIETLFREPLGRLMVIASATLSLTGLFLNHRIARVEL